MPRSPSAPADAAMSPASQDQSATYRPVAADLLLCCSQAGRKPLPAAATEPLRRTKAGNLRHAMAMGVLVCSLLKKKMTGIRGSVWMSWRGDWFFKEWISIKKRKGSFKGSVSGSVMALMKIRTLSTTAKLIYTLQVSSPKPRPILRTPSLNTPFFAPAVAPDACAAIGL